MTLSLDVAPSVPSTSSPWLLTAVAALVGIVLVVLLFRRGRRTPPQ